MEDERERGTTCYMIRDKIEEKSGRSILISKILLDIYF